MTHQSAIQSQHAPATILKPDQSRVLLRPFSPGDPQRVGRIIAEIMSLPEDQVGAACWTKSPLNSRSGTSRSANSFWNALNRSASCCSADRGSLRAKTTADRLLFPGRILAGIRRAVQSLHRSAPRPDRSAARRSAVCSQLARHRRRTHFLHHLSHRFIHADHRIEVLTPTGFLTEPRQIPNPVYEKPLFERKLSELGLTGEFTRPGHEQARRVVRARRTSRQSRKPNSSACRME